MTDVKQAVNTLGAAKWKFWITEKQRRDAREDLLKADAANLAQAVDHAIEVRSVNTQWAVRDALASLDDQRLPVLVEAGRRTRDPQAIELLCEVFRNMGSRAEGAIPLLKQWVRLERDPRLSGSGVEEIDAMLRNQFFEQNPESAVMEGFMSAQVRKPAARTLGHMGRHAESALTSLRAQLEREKDEWARRNIEDAIKDIEKDMVKKR